MECTTQNTRADITACLKDIIFNTWNSGISSLKPILWRKQSGLLTNWHGIQAQNVETDIAGFRFLWPCIARKVWREKSQQDATIRCLLLTSVSTCFGHHYAHLQENKEPVTAFGVFFWFRWMWLVAIVGRCVVGCEQAVCCSGHYVEGTAQQLDRNIAAWMNSVTAIIRWNFGQ